MATTTNYSFNLPAIGGDADQWGTKLNNNWTSLDSILYAGGGGGGAVLNLDNYTADGMTLTGVVSIDIDGGITEEVYSAGATGTLDIDPDNGTIQTIDMTGDVTLTFNNLGTGQFVTLRITSVGSNSFTFPTMEWLFGTAPSLNATGTNWVQIWKVGTQLYGSYIGYTATP
jgi:hypothetical protein